VTDQTTLMEVMEAQEAVEEAQTEEEVEGLKRENSERMRATEEVMGRAFEEGDVQRAKVECVRLKYWVSLEQVLRDWEPGREVRLVH
jgi:molecular chaperone HscB